MLVGHFAPALGLRAVSDRVPLWALILGTQAVDVLFFVLVLAGVEGAALDPDAHPRLVVTAGVWSHSLAMTAVYFAACLGGGALLGRWREGALVGVAVASHWLADLIVHVPDLPVTLEQSSAVGLGLWRLPWAATALEVGLVAGGALWLSRSYPAGPARRRLAIVAGALILLQLASDLVVPAPESDALLAPMAWAIYGATTAAAWWAERPLSAAPRAPDPTPRG
ncbi:MAG: hypothetical protein R3B82_20670 [Sandaracinaceae bacterium]